MKRLLFRPVLGQFGGRLHTIGVGASALEVDVAQRWMEMGVDILQGYGATEMGPVITFTRPGRNVFGTIGEPIPGVEVRIADDGEILARGPGRFAGYWQNPEATAAAIDEDGWYHTGRSGCDRRPDGMLTFRGRKKDMLALSDGQKVYPEDVEAILREDDRLRDATVVGWPLGSGLRVHAVLLMDDPALADDVIRTANTRLAPHQQIRGTTVWPDPDLPRTHTLKVRKPDVLARLADLERPGSAALPAAASAVLRDHADSEVDPVTAIIASIAGLEPAAVVAGRPGSRAISTSTPFVGSNSLASSRRSWASSSMTMHFSPTQRSTDLITLVQAGREAKRGHGMWRWPLSPAVRALGLAFQVLLMYPFVHLFYRVRTTGLERLAAWKGRSCSSPITACTSTTGSSCTRLPLGIRWKLSVAAAADTIYDNPLQGILASVIANAFPLQREGGVRKSLEMLGERLDRGFNILIYPEGKLTVGGPLQPFKAGRGSSPSRAGHRSCRSSC